MFVVMYEKIINGLKFLCFPYFSPKKSLQQCCAAGCFLPWGSGSSIGFFITNGLDVDFLEESVDTWEDPESSYQEAKAAVKTVPVVNDGAERGVKISSDFLEDARKEEIYQNILQVAENDRNLVANQRKRHIRIMKL